jgi:hypothetical protein
MPILASERIFYAKDVPSPSLDNKIFPHFFLKFIEEIYGDQENIPRRSKVRYFFHSLMPTSFRYYFNTESTKTALLEPPRNIVSHLKTQLFEQHPEGLCASEMKILLCETVETFTSHWLWDMTPREREYYERMATEGWDSI